jgi:hypothetical protein
MCERNGLSSSERVQAMCPGSRRVSGDPGSEVWRTATVAFAFSARVA